MSESGDEEYLDMALKVGSVENSDEHSVGFVNYVG